MRKLLLVLILVFIPHPAMCDGTGTLISWPGWTVISTEDLFNGHKHTSFPLTNLFDGNAATAWVFSGTGKHLAGWETGYSITLRRDGGKAMSMDSIWIMNGYNKSRELFLRNNRIVELKLYVNERFIKSVPLLDLMGWHKISMPRQRVREIKLRLTKFVKGRDDDVCVSEIACYNRGLKVDLKMPAAVTFTPGDGDCGCGQNFYIVDRSGKRIIEYDFDGPFAWSPSGRYIAGGDTDLWIVDTRKAKLIVNKNRLRDASCWVDDVSWKGDQAVTFDIGRELPKDKGVEHYKETYYPMTTRMP